ncbi:polysaccharide deacetylase family protein [Neorhizobium galegae]|uniref:polysaccharide deacetylase family protein n=1 Tax=Neorhizobium galegae TaxID=399 RepID=UPI0006226BD6|nr:polysaccharide deacetylase [Neorhizobium galegae]CDZ62087.1 Polysaccharide deacetylase [Neorhizobium galegae bv. orientalis]KAB1122084.1 polysaccharide deacetylase [Neorhizobium galegae]MCQ1574202.1 polysaccharide deacetylase [Neorhizobium galegae]MCQ1810532.1 polysaccharide deacetylase [Neorhizobium galegae]MCQ1837582.1 polysaccharide deacetylase [Neorhizobium galegae]
MTFDLTPRPLNPAAKTPDMTWPNGTKSALFIGFDVDAETAWIGNNSSNVDRMVTTSHGGYDARVGIARILGLMNELGLKATFFTPGWTALAHRAECEAMLAAGHEIGHHGYLHKLPDRTRLDEAMEEIDRGFEALQSALGVRPVGYRAPSGENFPELLAYLKKSGIRYSSSFRDDILPYRHAANDGVPGLVEIPVNYAFDDWNFGMTSRTSPRPIFGRDMILPLWIDEFEATHAWGGVTTLVLHPQVSGRPMRWHLLRDFLKHVLTKGDVWIATGSQITDHFEAQEAARRCHPA